MNAPVSLNQSGNRPIGVDVFDVSRRGFLKSFREFMTDTKVPVSIRDQELRATISAMSQIAALAEIG